MLLTLYKYDEQPDVSARWHRGKPQVCIKGQNWFMVMTLSEAKVLSADLAKAAALAETEKETQE